MSESPPPATLVAYAQQLQRCLQWNPVHGVEGEEKHVFVNALTEIAALPLDSTSMEIRLLVVANVDKTEVPQYLHLHNIIAALRARDVLLKCKAAIAVGSLCISRVAGQQLLGLYGEEIVQSVTKMATRKNQWVQGDALFVLGWIVVIADGEMLTTIAKLLPTVVKNLHRNVMLSLDSESNDLERKGRTLRRTIAALTLSEQASNFRVYALILLLNFSQRHVNVFLDQLETVLLMLKDFMVRLLDPVSTAALTKTTFPRCTFFFDASEYAEVLRLGITLLSVLSDQLEGTASQLLELRVLPLLLKLKRVLDSPDICNLIGKDGRQDLVGRLEAVVKVILNCNKT